MFLSMLYKYLIYLNFLLSISRSDKLPKKVVIDKIK